MDEVNVVLKQFCDGRKLGAERPGDGSFLARLLTLVPAMAACQDVTVFLDAVVVRSRVRVQAIRTFRDAAAILAAVHW